MNYFLAIFACSIALILLSVCIWTMKNGISPMPTGRRAKRMLFELLPDRVEGELVELGSGWGHIAHALAKRYPQNRVVGYENSPVPYYISMLALKNPNLSLQRKNFFDANLHDAGLIYCYLYPGAMQRLKLKFETECRPGALIVTHTFRIPGWTPLREVDVNDLYHSKLYLYKR